MQDTTISGAAVAEMTIAVLGLGHVGLPTALGWAELGWKVIAAESDESKVAIMKGGRVPFHEAGLETLLKKHLSNPRFELTSNVESAIQRGAVLFICVGTPQRPNGEADLFDVEALARTIAANLNSYKLIVEKSTVPALTGQWLQKTVERHAAAYSERSNGTNGNGHNGNAQTTRSGNTRSRLALFEVASNPEFLQEGKAVQDIFNPDRIVCGVSSERARSILASLYEPLGRPIVFTDLNTSELIKYAANAFLATKISFINMVAEVCDAIGADVQQVARGIGLDQRIGRSFLNAGIGYGGYCLPKDVRAFIHLADEKHADASMLVEAARVNDRCIQRYVKKVRQALWIVQGKKVAVLGLAFKAGTDDIRDSPALRIVAALKNEGANLQLYDPQAMDNVRAVLPPEPGRITYCESAYEAVEDAHALLILTEWDEFKNLRWSKVRRSMHIPVVVDGRNVCDPDVLRRYGFEYHCMGRGSVCASPRKSGETKVVSASAGSQLSIVPKAS